MSPSRTLPMAPPDSASGLTCNAVGTLPEAPESRPSVTSATRRPWFCNMPSNGVRLCCSGMPLARGPWKRSTATKSCGKAPARCSLASCAGSSSTTAGAVIAWRSGLSADTLISERPRLPLSRRRPPCASNGALAGRNTVSSPLLAGTSRHVNLPSRRYGLWL